MLYFVHRFFNTLDVLVFLRKSGGRMLYRKVDLLNQKPFFKEKG